jgi:hypothetical protein
LPRDLLDDLQQAVLGGDISAIEEHVARTAQLEPQLGAELRKLAEMFDYETLSDLLTG